MMLSESSALKNLKYILLTHGHFDHIGGAAIIKGWPMERLWCFTLSPGLRQTARWILEKAFYSPVEPFQPDITLREADTLPFGGESNYSSPYAWPYQRQLRLLPRKYSFYRRYANTLQHRQNGFSNRKSCGNESFFIQTGRFGGGIFGIPWSRRTDNASKRKGKQSIFRTK